jgi:hypothetical protein
VAQAFEAIAGLEAQQAIAEKMSSDDTMSMEALVAELLAVAPGALDDAAVAEVADDLVADDEIAVDEIAVDEIAVDEIAVAEIADDVIADVDCGGLESDLGPSADDGVVSGTDEQPAEGADPAVLAHHDGYQDDADERAARRRGRWRGGRGQRSKPSTMR